MVDISQVNEVVRPAVEALGYELWGCEYFPHGRQSVLRVYIDSLGGVTLADCEQVSRQVSAVLDVAEPFPGQYTLEVSSPGEERPLFTATQYEQYIGHCVDVQLAQPLAGRRHFKGMLRDVIEAQQVQLEVDGQRHVLPMADIKRAHVSRS